MGEYSMKRRSFLVFLTIFFVLFTCVGGIQGKASSGTNVSGIINQDTIWTVAGSPYSLTGDIQIANGVKLKVEPGVTIEGNNFRIRDFGEFEAIGNPDSKIILNNVNVEPGAGDSSQRYLIHIENADMNNGSLYRPTGNAIYGSLILKDSRLSNLSSYVYLWYPISDVDIERNVFVNSGGISVGTSGNVKVNILNNVFSNYTNFAVENWASYDTSETVVSYNSFLNPNGSSSYALVLPAGYSSTKMTAFNNYYGTTDEAVIEKMIFDKNDDLSSANYINYKPYILAPDPNTPDITPPSAPNVYEVSDKSTSVTGTAEVGSTITVTAGTNILGTTIVNGDGTFSVPIDLQKAETKLTVTATDAAGNISDANEITVKDVTAPGIPTVNDIADNSTSVTGTAEPGATITVTAGTSVLGTTVVNDDGTYSVPIDLQKAGTKLTVTATDGAGNISEAAEVTVIDGTPPNIPQVSDITDKSTSVTGTAEVGSTITVTAGTSVLGTTLVNDDGTYSVPIDLQKAGTKLTVTATDAVGNISDTNEVIVKDVTAPGIPAVNDIADNSTNVTGKAEPGSTITVTTGTSVLGTTVVNDDGTYSVPIDLQKAGTKLTVTAKDNAGNISEAAEVTVKDGTPPNIPQVSDITDKLTSVTGTAEAGATITVKSGTRVIGTVDVNGEGNFTAPIGLQQAGTILTVTATDATGNVSNEATVTVMHQSPTVERISGATRMDTAVEIAKMGWQSANTVVIATGYDFPDALAGAPLAYKLNAPILLTNNNGLSDSTKQEIIDLKATSAVILGGTSAVSSDVEQQLKSLGITNIERLAGSNRFETASMIAEKLGGNPSTAILADGYNYPDALSVASYAAQNGYPILLTRTDALPSETNNQLAGKTKTIVVGGEVAVSNNVLNSVSGAERISGATRFETGANLVTQLQLSTEKVFIATGRNFADALTGSVLAAKEKAPMLLVEQNSIPDPINNLFVSLGISNVDILGGNTTVSDLVENQLKN
jgi:putative cell wall-binding protein